MEKTKRKHILFVTTANLATNPRLVKEIHKALTLDSNVTVISFSFNNWSNKINEEIKNSMGASVNIIEIAAGRKPFLSWLLGSLLQKISSLLIKLGIGQLSILALSLNKRSWLLQNRLTKIKERPDIVIAHNPGSFYAAMKFAKKNNSCFGVDVEDYHPGEYKDESTAAAMKKYMQYILPQADYVSAASPLILEKILEDCKGKIKRSKEVLNYFPAAEFKEPVKPVLEKLQLVWFSQYIDAGRGLEEILPAADELHKEVELHLIGNLNQVFAKKYIEGKNGVILHEPMQPQKLHRFLSEFDIGLAIEPGRDLNNRLALSNKILTYYQAGLFILASNTTAQKKFIADHQDHGTAIELTAESIKASLLKLVADKEEIRNNAAKRYNNALSSSSETELEKLSVLWQGLFQKKS